MTHEYPRNPTFDSVSVSRVSALGDFGFTQRQREFLVTVMVHSGCFLERQYCRFTGTARGQNSREFVAAWLRADSPEPSSQDLSAEGVSTTFTTSRCMRPSGSRTTVVAVSNRSAAWSRG